VPDIEAAQYYYRTAFEEIEPAAEHFRKALFEYCKRDTLASAELRKTLPQKASVN
jgi:hypothetical protein